LKSYLIVFLARENSRERGQRGGADGRADERPGLSLACKGVRLGRLGKRDWARGAKQAKRSGGAGVEASAGDDGQCSEPSWRVSRGRLQLYQRPGGCRVVVERIRTDEREAESGSLSDGGGRRQKGGDTGLRNLQSPAWVSLPPSLGFFIALVS
jgi:hypothetical protein